MGPLIRSGLYAGDKANEALTSGISFPKTYCSILEFRTAYNPTSMQKSSNPPFLPSQLGPPRTLRYWWHFSAPPPIPHICCSFFFFNLTFWCLTERRQSGGKNRKTFFFGGGGRRRHQESGCGGEGKNQEGNRSNGNKHDKNEGKGEEKEKFTTEQNTQQKTLTC